MNKKFVALLSLVIGVSIAAILAGYVNAAGTPKSCYVLVGRVGEPMPVGVGQTVCTSVQPFAQWLIGEEFDFTYYGGNRWDFTSTHALGCSDGSHFQVPNGGGQSWNDKFQSAKTWAQCDIVRHYEHANFGGGIKSCIGSCVDLESLNNKTSSLKWMPD